MYYVDWQAATAIVAQVGRCDVAAKMSWHVLTSVG